MVKSAGAGASEPGISVQQLAKILQQQSDNFNATMTRLQEESNKNQAKMQEKALEDKILMQDKVKKDQVESETRFNNMMTLFAKTITAPTITPATPSVGPVHVTSPVPTSGPPKILDMMKCTPNYQAYAHHGTIGTGEIRKTGTIKTIIWTQHVTTEPQYEIYIPMESQTITQRASKVWCHIDTMTGNNECETIKGKNCTVDIMNFSFLPGSSVEFVRNFQKYKGVIEKIELDANIDVNKIIDTDFKYTIVQPNSSGTIIASDVTSDMLVACYSDGMTESRLQKSISSLLSVNTSPLLSLLETDLKEWYNHSRRILATHHITLPAWSQITKNMTYDLFIGENGDPVKANQLFMFLSREEVIPNAISKARAMITHAIGSDGYHVLFKLIQSHHPHFTSNKRSPAWPTFLKEESLRTFILRTQSHAEKESSKGRTYGNMEILNIIYDNIPESKYPKTRNYIDDALEDYDDEDPTKIPEKWHVYDLDTTLTRYADKKKEPKSYHDNSRVNKVTNDNDENEDITGYETCDDTSSVNFTSQARHSDRRNDPRGRHNFRHNDRGRQPYRSRDYSRDRSRSFSTKDDKNKKSVLLDDIKEYIDATFTDDLVKKFRYGRDSLAKKLYNKKIDSEKSGSWRQRKGSVKNRPQKNERNNVNVLVHHILDGFHACDDDITFDTLDVDDKGNIQLKD